MGPKKDGDARLQVHPTLLRGMSEDPMENWPPGFLKQNFRSSTVGLNNSECGRSEQKPIVVFHVCYPMVIII